MEEAETHKRHIARCLELAALAEGRTSPNPMVGAVVVDSNGMVVGEGYHERYGEAHAEVNALNQAGEKAKGGTIYVSLEPCSHFGKTPPCADRVIASGIKRVFAAIGDPNPKVDGGGFRKLKEAGVEVVSDLAVEESLWLNRGFFKRIRLSMPWLTLKVAATLDGRIADRNGTSRWITGPEARLLVHDWRNRYDAVMVGATTVRLDDPELNVRDIEGGRNPIRVLIEGREAFDPKLRALDSDLPGRALVFVREEQFKERRAHYPAHVEVLSVPSKRSRVDLHAVLKSLSSLGVAKVLCEGGGQLAGALIEARLVDDLQWFLAPKLLLDTNAKDALVLYRALLLKDAVKIDLITCRPIGGDILVSGLVKYD